MADEKRYLVHTLGEDIENNFYGMATLVYMNSDVLVVEDSKGKQRILNGPFEIDKIELSTTEGPQRKISISPNRP